MVVHILLCVFARAREEEGYFDLYNKQHGLEANLFLAPGEGETVERV
jgi:hypothetical protein